MIRIKAENRWLRRFLLQTPVDLVISDNRYGLYAAGTGCIFITHQLAIRTGFGRLPDRWLRQANYAFIQRFMACWVPDEAGPDNLAGKLSHPRRMPAVPVRYIGWLSRFGAAAGEPGQPQPAPRIDLLLLLSGPEPQRTILEDLLLAQLHTANLGRVAMVRGLPGGGREPIRAPGVEVHDYLGTAALGTLIGLSRVILSRPGFSTVMDLAALRKRAIFIPTPGQTEQEYLGRYLAGKGWAVCRRQRGFMLPEALAGARKLNPALWPAAGDRQLLSRVIKTVRTQSAADFG
ncbi:MAG TPA: glycosyltransferase [Puia sp.]|nr:glycosyltransferase [Puia sp.]